MTKQTEMELFFELAAESLRQLAQGIPLTPVNLVVKDEAEAEVLEEAAAV